MNIYEEDGKLILEKKKSISRDEYEKLLDDAKEYAAAMGLDENDCYGIIEEYMASLK